MFFICLNIYFLTVKLIIFIGIDWDKILKPKCQYWLIKILDGRFVPLLFSLILPHHIIEIKQKKGKRNSEGYRQTYRYLE